MPKPTTTAWDPTAWLNERTLQVSSLAAQGAWCRLCNIMIADDVPSLRHTLQEYAALLHTNYDEAKAVIRELIGKYVAESDTSPLDFAMIGPDAHVTLSSRRLARIHKVRELAQLRKKRQRQGAQASRGPDNDASACAQEHDQESVLIYEYGEDLLRGEGEGSWWVTQEMHSGWLAAYPDLVHLSEYRKAGEWLKANPSRCKTRVGMQRFLNSWLTKAQNNAWRSSGPGKRPASAAPGTLGDGVYEKWQGTKRPKED